MVLRLIGLVGVGTDNGDESGRLVENRVLASAIVALCGGGAGVCPLWLLGGEWLY